jgi:hypothetical protein
MSVAVIVSGRCGTRSGYVAGCRCRACRDANRDRYRERHARMAEGAAEVLPSGPPIAGTMKRGGRIVSVLRCPGANGSPCVREGRAWLKGREVCGACVERVTVWDGLVPVARAQAHLRALSAKGVGYKAVSAASDVARSVLARVLTGEGVIRASSERRILAVDDGARADGALVDGARVREIIAALRARGFSCRQIARARGVHESEVSAQARRPRSTAATVAAYERVLRRVERGDLTPQRTVETALEERALLRSLLDRGVPAAALSERLGFHVKRSTRGMRPQNAAAVRALRDELETMRREGLGLPDGWETASSGAIGAIAGAFGFAEGWSVGGLSRGEATPKRPRKRVTLRAGRKLEADRQRQRERRAAMTVQARRAEWLRAQHARRARLRAAAVQEAA